MEWFRKHITADGHGQIQQIDPHQPQTVAAPELNPGAGVSAILVLGIVLAILTGERRGKAAKKQSGRYNYRGEGDLSEWSDS
jgi:hypothetical protein